MQTSNVEKNSQIVSENMLTVQPMRPKVAVSQMLKHHPHMVMPIAVKNRNKSWKLLVSRLSFQAKIMHVCLLPPPR